MQTMKIILITNHVSVVSYCVIIVANGQLK